MRAIFVTGAASGIGAATARLFAARGWFVGACDRDAERLAELQHTLGGPSVCWTSCFDVTDREAFDVAMATFGSITGGVLDLLFNNAGIGQGGAFADQPFDRVRDVVEVNVFGVLYGIRAALPLLRATQGALCFSMSSASAIFGLPGIAAYAASKAAVKALTEALAAEFQPLGIRVADALPGLVQTDLLSPTTAARAASTGPFRLIQPDDVAAIVWRAYHADRLHWYVPEDLKDLARAAADDAETLRAQAAARSGPFAWMAR